MAKKWSIQGRPPLDPRTKGKGKPPPPDQEQLREGVPWPMPPDQVVRVQRPGSPYLVDVELTRDSEGQLVPTGISVRRPVPMEPQDVGKATDPRWPDDAEPLPLLPRDVRRLPMLSYVEAAVAWATRPLDEQRGPALQRALLRGGPQRGKSIEFYEGIAKAYRRYAAEGIRPVPAIAKWMGVPPNTVHQWVYRARQLGRLEKPTRKPPKTTRRKR